MGVTTTGKTPAPTGTQLARRRAASARRERIMTSGRRLDLMLPPEAAQALERAAQPGESATATIVRVLLQAAKRRLR